MIQNKLSGALGSADGKVIVLKKRMSIIIIAICMIIMPSTSYIAQAQAGQQEITSDGTHENDAESISGITLVQMDSLSSDSDVQTVSVLGARTSDVTDEGQTFAEVESDAEISDVVSEDIDDTEEEDSDVWLTVDMSAFSDILSSSNVNVDERQAKDLIVSQTHNGEYNQTILAANPYDAMTVAYNKAVRQEEPDQVNEISEYDSYKQVSENDFNEDDLYVLSHVIFAEAGSMKCSDTSRYYVGSVVLNRVKSKYFKGDTIKDIVFAAGQYACVDNGSYYSEPTERCVEIAKDLLANGSVLPDNVLYQANFKQGDSVYEYIDTLYFCTKD